MKKRKTNDLKWFDIETAKVQTNIRELKIKNICWFSKNTDLLSNFVKTVAIMLNIDHFIKKEQKKLK